MIDLAEVPFGDSLTRPLPMRLEGFYDSGDQRSMNRLAQWSSSDPYLTISKIPITGGGGTTVPDALVTVRYDQEQACPQDDRAFITADLNGDEYVVELINIPCN